MIAGGLANSIKLFALTRKSRVIRAWIGRIIRGPAHEEGRYRFS